MIRSLFVGFFILIGTALLSYYLCEVFGNRKSLDEGCFRLKKHDVDSILSHWSYGDNESIGDCVSHGGESRFRWYLESAKPSDN